MKIIQHKLIVPTELQGQRLDQALAQLLPDHSRTEIQHWIKQEQLTVNGHPAKAKMTIKGGEKILVEAEQKIQPEYEAQPIPLDIVYEDEALLIVNKAKGMVVHPAAGNRNNTLLNALLFHVPELSALPRAGIIHRLDKDTTGLLMIAKTELAFKRLSLQLKKRVIAREYQAVVTGILLSGGTVNEPIGRHPLHRKHMAVIETGRPAVTHYRVMEKYKAHTLLKISLETGRTHQIRVHMAHIRHPIVGDATYGGQLKLPKGASPELVTALRTFKRQALHAYALALTHPVSGEAMRWEAPLPADMTELVEILRKDKITSC